MSWSVLILIAVVAVAGYFVLRGRGAKPGEPGGAVPVPAAPPVPMPAAHAPRVPTAGTVASYDEYRRTNPSHFINGKLTCNRCGSNLIRVQGDSGHCSNCGAALYGAR